MTRQANNIPATMNQSRMTHLADVNEGPRACRKILFYPGVLLGVAEETPESHEVDKIMYT